MITLGEIVKETLRNQASRLAANVMAGNPLYETVKYGYRKRETDKWLSGAPDVSMWHQWDQPYQGWPQ